MTPVALDCVPEHQRKRMIWTSRIFMAIKSIVIILWALHYRKLSTNYVFCVFLNYMEVLFCNLTTMLQHGGLKADSWDHQRKYKNGYYLIQFMVGLLIF